MMTFAILPDEEPAKPKPQVEKPKAKPRAATKRESGPSSEEMLFWNSIKDSDNPEDFRAYLEQYPRGRFVRLARNRLEGESSDDGQTEAGSAKARAGAKSLRDCSGCLEMVRLPALGISMGKYEVTQELWKAVMANNPSYFSSCGENCPVEQVSWNDIQEFIERLNQLSGQRYRLPTEEEWYAACQAGRSTEYCGSDNIDSVAWYNNYSSNHTYPIGQKQANAWGLYDMSGNVREWTSSCYEGDCSRRVYRGGSWFDRPVDVRSAYRNWYVTTNRGNNLGFRLAQD